MAELFHFGKGNYFDFFTKLGDLTGYQGGFTTGQLWFILYLFVISLVCLPFMLLYNKRSKKTLLAKANIILLIILGIAPAILSKAGDIGGKPIGTFAAFFLLGFFFLSEESVLDKLTKRRWILLAISLVWLILKIIFWNFEFNETHQWITVLCILAFSRKYFNPANKITHYLSKASYGIYIFHQSALVVVGYLIFEWTSNTAIQAVCILAATIISAFAAYELLKRIRPLRWMFALKK